MHQAHARHAFTLIELAIVLVIIGLVIGGVLVSQALISASGIRATVSQIEHFNVGANTFRTKYNGLPGDLRAIRAAAFNLQPRSGDAGQGDGNGLLHNGNVAGARQGLGHETALFWRDLSEGDMIGGVFTTATDAPAASITTTQIPSYMHYTKVRQNTYFHIYSVGGRNFYYIGGFTPTATNADGTLSLVSTISPADAYSIDEKIDDAVGNSGVMLAVNDIVTNTILSGTGISGDCLNADGTYNVDDSHRDLIACRAATRTSF